MALLEFENLVVEFETATGPFRAVDGVSLSVDQREVLAIVGESGSGKSVSMLAVMGLLPWTAKVTADRMNFAGTDLLKLSVPDRRKIVGKDMAMIFQEPMASLNPCFTVGFQIEEVLRVHMGMDRAQRRARAIELLKEVGIPDPAERLGHYPHQMSGGQCQRVMIAIAIACNPEAPDRRRADHRARRHDPEADPRPFDEAAGRARHGADHDHPQYGRGRRDGRPRHRPVQGAQDGGGGRAVAVRDAQERLYARAAFGAA